MIVSSQIGENLYGLDINDIGVVKNIDNDILSIYFIRINRTINLNIRHTIEIDPDKYGDLFDEKICNICHRILPTKDFALNQTGVGNRPVRRPSCLECRVDIDGKPMIDRGVWDDSKPSLTDFKCPICEKTTIPGLTSKVVLDHDHRTGKITGYICDSCNTGLGRFKDDTVVLERAIKYLKSGGINNVDYR
jgi:uncharacterized protein YlaI